MKKIISVLLCLVMVFSVFATSFTANAADKNENLPMIFVTGIGQTFSHIKADSEEDADNIFEYKYVDENGEYAIEKIPTVGKSKGYNLFLLDAGTTLKNIVKSPTKLIKSLVAITQLLQSLFTGTYTVSDENFATVIRELFYLMTVDENGNLPDKIFTPLYTYPVEDYTKAAKSRFDNTVPCPELIKEYGEDRVFCFNYSPFGSMEDLTDKLNDYINNVQETYFPGQKVILVPMSMGASVVSNYLYKYGDQNDVAKVISIVGCWQGSDVFADLVEGKYAENSPEIFYTELVSDLAGGGGLGSLVNILIQCFSKETLTPALKTFARLASDELILKTPTLLGLIPPDRYEDIRETYLTRPGYENALAEADEYHKAQVAVKDTLKKLNQEQGVEFYFISGYGLGFGGVSSTYAFFKCFNTAKTTNSDEIIQIESTAVGATSVTPGTQFSEEYIKNAEANGTAKYITPDKSVDLSTAVFPDRCFVFYQQKHELENNEVALELAMRIAINEIKDINSNPEEFPQVNTFVDNDLDEQEEWDYYLSFITKPLSAILYFFTGPQGIPDLFK